VKNHEPNCSTQL